MKGSTPQAKAASRLTKLLAKREHSTAAARAQLLKWRFDQPTADAVVADFAARRLLDDRRAAESFVRSHLARKPIAPALLREKLLKLLIPADLADQTLAAAFAPPEADPAAAAAAFAKAALARLPAKLARPAKLRRLAAQLARRGYDESAVESALAAAGLL